jgi:phage-related protein
MAVFNYTPHASTQIQPVLRKLKTQFGNGYVQEMQDGLNSIMRKWSLVWQNIPPDNVDATVTSAKKLNDFFEANFGSTFVWTQPPPFDADGAKNWVCDDWSPTYTDALLGFNATFEQRP